MKDEQGCDTAAGLPDKEETGCDIMKTLPESVLDCETGDDAQLESDVSELGCATGADLGCQREGKGIPGVGGEDGYGVDLDSGTGSELGCDTGEETFARTKREIVSTRLVLPMVQTFSTWGERKPWMPPKKTHGRNF